MQVGSPEWIEASIAKLEQLEQERAEHEAAIETVKEPMALRRHNDALSRLDGEIKSLYALLEQYAEDDEEEEAEQEAAAAIAATPAPRTVGDEELSAPHRAAAPVTPPPSAPLAAPITHTPPAASPVSVAPMAAPTPSYEGDDELKSGKGKWVVLGLLLVAGVGVGGFFMMQQQKKDTAPAATQTGSGEVIKAADVPDDTEAPKAAKGADVDRTPVDDPGADAAAKRAAEREEKKKLEKEKEKKKIKLGGTDEPLG